MRNKRQRETCDIFGCRGMLVFCFNLPGQLQKGQKTRAERRGQGKWEMNALTQAGWNTSGTTQPLLDHQSSPRLANKTHYGSLINGSPLQGVKEMEQSMMTSLPGRGGGRKKSGPLAAFHNPVFVQHKQLLFILWSCSSYLFGDQTFFSFKHSYWTILKTSYFTSVLQFYLKLVHKIQTLKPNNILEQRKGY